MINKKKLEETVLEKIHNTGIFLVDIEVNTGNIVKIFVDSEKGVSIDECVELNRYITARHDKDEEDYELEVSSPGLNMSFRVKEQYLKYLNKDIEVVKKDGTKHKGVLLRYEDDAITLEEQKRVKVEGKKKKQLVVEQLRLPFDEVKSTKATVSFK